MSSAILGKRKRKAIAKEEPKPDTAALEDAQAIFRRHFETQFAPIQDEKKRSNRKGAGSNDTTEDARSDSSDADGLEDMRSDSESDEDAWDGLSGEEERENDDGDDGIEGDSETGTSMIQVVDYSKPMPSSTLTPQTATMSKRELRAYLSSRPPDATSTSDLASKSKQKPGEKDDPQNEDSKTLLANDLELQRLINESHILSASNPFNSIGSRSSADGGGGKTFMQGRTRTLTTDMRLQALGSKTSILKQRNMPMGMRKGINAAKGAKEDKRRREARENGIILETPQDNKGKNKKSKRGGRDLAVDMPGMGRFKGGELKLSKREVNAVTMEGKRMDFGGKRRKRRR